MCRACLASISRIVPKTSTGSVALNDSTVRVPRSASRPWIRTRLGSYRMTGCTLRWPSSSCDFWISSAYRGMIISWLTTASRLTRIVETQTGRITRCVLIPAASIASSSLLRCIQVTVKIAAIMPITPQSRS